jgi:hypothetical protein
MKKLEELERVRDKVRGNGGLAILKSSDEEEVWGEGLELGGGRTRVRQRERSPDVPAEREESLEVGGGRQHKEATIPEALEVRGHHRQKRWGGEESGAMRRWAWERWTTMINRRRKKKDLPSRS